MNDKIIKGFCNRELCEPALKIINRQQAEITKMNGVISYLESAYTSVADEVKAKTVQEFAEKLKTEIAGLEVKSPNTTYKCGMEDVLYYRMPKIIDRLLEEMTEGEKR